jgi:stearoyl-CoA desaturase (delta-9 desaturase)
VAGQAPPQRLFCWPNVIWLALVHAGALAAPFFFSWEGLLLTLLLHWFTGGIGVCLGFHRHLTHTSFATYRPVRWLLALIGGLAGEGSVLNWVADHRKHHAYSDQPGDPHSPHDGPWWSHVFWLAFWQGPEQQSAHLRRWAPDLLRDPVLCWIAAMFLPSQFALAALVGYVGWLWGGWYMATSLVVWGVFVRLVFVLHSTWLVNSASHMWGYRNYETTDDSRNNWWVALLTYGEGWHNNHHAYPRMALHGHRWWELDLTFRTIRLMQRLGLAWDVVDYKRGGAARESSTPAHG